MSKPATRALGKASTVEISLVMLLCGGIAAGATWMTRTSIELDYLKQLIMSDMSDRWRASDMQQWVNEANSESKRWSVTVERQLSLPSGGLDALVFPEPRPQPRNN